MFALRLENPIWAAVVFCILVAWSIGFVVRRSNVKEDTAVGVFFASTMALGILIISLQKGYQVDLFSYLFGSILAVTTQDVWITAIITAIVFACIAVFFKDLMFITFDPETAEITGVPAGKLYYLLLTLMALTIVMSIKVVGIVLVSALIVTPAAAAFQLTEDFRKMMALSVVIGVGSCLAGLIISGLQGLPAGASIVLISTLAFFLAAAFSPRRRRIRAMSKADSKP